MELRIKEAVWRFESVYASIFDNIITLLWSLMQHTTPTS